MTQDEINTLIESAKDFAKRSRKIIDFIAENTYTRQEYVSLITQLYEPIRREKEEEIEKMPNKQYFLDDR